MDSIRAAVVQLALDSKTGRSHGHNILSKISPDTLKEFGIVEAGEVDREKIEVEIIRSSRSSFEEKDYNGIKGVTSHHIKGAKEDAELKIKTSR
jgi:hypothetical protein